MPEAKDTDDAEIDYALDERTMLLSRLVSWYETTRYDAMNGASDGEDSEIASIVKEARRLQFMPDA